MRRTQIYLHEHQAAELDSCATAGGLTRSEVIRTAVDEYLARAGPGGGRLADFHDALDEAFGVAPQLPPGDEYVREMRSADRAREGALERRRRA